MLLSNAMQHTYIYICLWFLPKQSSVWWFYTFPLMNHNDNKSLPWSFVKLYVIFSHFYGKMKAWQIEVAMQKMTWYLRTGRGDPNLQKLMILFILPGKMVKVGGRNMKSVKSFQDFSVQFCIWKEVFKNGNMVT